VPRADVAGTKYLKSECIKYVEGAAVPPHRNIPSRPDERHEAGQERIRVDLRADPRGDLVQRSTGTAVASVVRGMKRMASSCKDRASCAAMGRCSTRIEQRTGCGRRPGATRPQGSRCATSTPSTRRTSSRRSKRCSAPKNLSRVSRAVDRVGAREPSRRRAHRRRVLAAGHDADRAGRDVRGNGPDEGAREDVARESHRSRAPGRGGSISTRSSRSSPISSTPACFDVGSAGRHEGAEEEPAARTVGDG
jgi:hypothetical protein